MQNKSVSGRVAGAVSGLMRRFRRERDGVVAIEFALIAPVLVLMLLGTTSLTNSIWANSKVDHTANIIGDLVSQSEELDESISGDESLLVLMQAAPSLLAPFDAQSISVTVAQVMACYRNPNSPNSDIDYYVVWGREWSGGDRLSKPNGYRNGALSPTDLGDLRIADGDYLIMTEVSYLHVPPIKISSSMSIDMEEAAFHQPRNGAKVSLSTEGGGNDLSCADLR